MSAIQFYVALPCLLVLAACSRGSKGAGQDSGGESEPVTPVQVETAKRGTIRHIITAEAVLYPLRQANIMPKINAPVQRFLVQRGDHVHEGQLLAVLEDRDLVAAAQESKELYEQAQATYENLRAATMPEDITKAKTDVESARQALDAASRVYQSREKLFREGALAQRLVDEAKVTLVQAQSQCDTARQHLISLQTVGRAEQLKSALAQVAAAKAHYASAEAQLSYAEIRSPIAGAVSDRPLNLGEMASSSSALISIVDISRVVARASVPVHEAAAIRVGRPSAISGGGGQLAGKVTVVSPAVDPNTTTVQIWVEATNTGERLKPGTTVQIAVDTGEITDAVIVPVTALLASAEGVEKVMVAGSDSLAHDRKVKVGVRDGDEVQILDGLKPGEQVITVGGLGLDDRAKIEITKPEAEAIQDEGAKK
jgi:HlyD family secretion protein